MGQPTTNQSKLCDKADPGHRLTYLETNKITDNNQYCMTTTITITTKMTTCYPPTTDLLSSHKKLCVRAEPEYRLLVTHFTNKNQPTITNKNNKCITITITTISIKTMPRSWSTNRDLRCVTLFS
jgi:hypothetical protein